MTHWIELKIFFFPSFCSFSLNFRSVHILQRVNTIFVYYIFTISSFWYRILTIKPHIVFLDWSPLNINIEYQISADTSSIFKMVCIVQCLNFLSENKFPLKYRIGFLIEFNVMKGKEIKKKPKINKIVISVEKLNVSWMKPSYLDFVVFTINLYIFFLIQNKRMLYKKYRNNETEEDEGWKIK